jgi:hypothetical protein
MVRGEEPTSVVEWSEGLRSRVPVIIRCTDQMTLVGYTAVSFITFFIFFWFCFVSMCACLYALYASV